MTINLSPIITNSSSIPQIMNNHSFLTPEASNDPDSALEVSIEQFTGNNQEVITEAIQDAMYDLGAEKVNYVRVQVDGL
jgi:hypothetical protein